MTVFHTNEKTVNNMANRGVPGNIV